MQLSVIISTHNPHPARLARTLRGLAQQNVAASIDWEVVLVDNASATPLRVLAEPEASQLNLRVVREPVLGLTHARRRGLQETTAPLIVLVDDDNVLAPDYIEQTRRIFLEHANLGAIGGIARPEFEATPPSWTEEFFPLLALRDLGPDPLVANTLRVATEDREGYPSCAPIGAGMGLRRAAAESWLKQKVNSELLDRQGNELTSAGDNDIVLTLMRAGWGVGYFPTLKLTHLIPASRLAADYLCRLNRGIQTSWMRVLTRHNINPWPPLSPGGSRLRILKAWFSYRAWSSAAARVRWEGARGHFLGRTISPAS